MRFKRIHRSIAVLALLYNPLCLADSEAFIAELTRFSKSLTGLYERLPLCEKGSEGEVCTTAEQIKAQLNKIITDNFQPDYKVQAARFKKLLLELENKFGWAEDIPFYRVWEQHAYFADFYENNHDKPRSVILAQMGYDDFDTLLDDTFRDLKLYRAAMEKTKLKDNQEAKKVYDNIFNWLFGQYYAEKALEVIHFYLNGFDENGYLIGFEPIDQVRRPYTQDDIDFYSGLLNAVKKVMGQDDLNVQIYESWLDLLKLAKDKVPDQTSQFTDKQLPVELAFEQLEKLLSNDEQLWKEDKNLWVSNYLQGQKTLKLLLKLYIEKTDAPLPALVVFHKEIFRF